ncbi:MAG: hypothetical protein ACTSQ6_11405 [Candidatus Heimdallarchaeaceae archaeon]
MLTPLAELKIKLKVANQPSVFDFKNAIQRNQIKAFYSSFNSCSIISRKNKLWNNNHLEFS